MITEEYLKNNFYTAYFIDEERKNIEVLTTSEDGKRMIPTIIPFDEKNDYYKALSKFMSVDQLHESTYKKKKEEKRIFENQVIKIAKKEGLVLDTHKLDTKFFPLVVKAIFEDDRLVQNPDLALDPIIAKQITDWYMEKNAPAMAKKLGIDMNNMTQDQANLLATSTIAGRKIERGGEGYLSSTLAKVDMYAEKIKGGSISPSGTGSVSGGISGSVVNASSKIQNERGGGNNVVVNNNNVDNSQVASVNSTTAMSPTPSRNKNVIRTDYRYDQVYGV